MKDIVILPADKRRLAEALDKTDYMLRLQGLLGEKNAYQLWGAGEFKKHMNSVKMAIDKLKKSGALIRRETLAAKATYAAMARFYDLPTVHKPGVPLRPIVSLRDTPSFGQSKGFDQLFRFLTEDSECTFKSAGQFLRNIKHLEIDSE
ncbi:unnamed protein product [Dibothriocephalus latus]|uniref:Uncharacterized protein n=1 Tax=Dibothriocephalus latus TaxID=60516 RepID=A0A3P7MFY9_DIBLA|nr:unnamed protein product [Dibothriocephalus latus]